MSDGAPTTPSAPAPRERRMLDRYELIAEIARGGMGTVMLARLEGAGGFQRFFALKMMHAHLAEDRQFVHMLLDEARLAARIHHPNVVATVDVCENKVGTYLVMDWVEGFTLAQIVDHPRLDATDRVRLGNRILLDAMAGLDAAHNLTGDDGSPLGIVHRDVSPQNVLVGLDGVARITDFGVALAASRITSSRPGIIKGKPAYMAPEQARGEALDRRADVFALGVMLWECLTGQRLFVADSDAGTVYKVIHAPIARPRELAPELPEGVEAACLHALARDTALRTPTARAMAGELGRAAEAAGMVAPAHEVAEKLAALFAEEIADRRAAIREHLATLGPASAPIVASDVFDMPKLRQSASRPAVSEEDALAATKAARTPGSVPATTLRERPGGAGVPETRAGELAAPASPTAEARRSTDGPPPLPARLDHAHDVATAATETATPVATAAAVATKTAEARGVSSRVLLVWAACVVLALVGTVWLVARMAPRLGERPAADLAQDRSPAEAPAPEKAAPTAAAPAKAAPAAPTPTATPPAAPPAAAPTPATPAPAATATAPGEAHPQAPSRAGREPGKNRPIEVEANPYR